MAIRRTSGAGERLDLSEPGDYVVQILSVREVEGDERKFTVYDALNLATKQEVSFGHLSRFGDELEPQAVYLLSSNGLKRGRKGQSYYDVESWLLDADDLKSIEKNGVSEFAEKLKGSIPTQK